MISVIGIGTVVNVAAIIVGGLIGLLFKGGLKEHYQEAIVKSLGLCAMFIGAAGALPGLLRVEDGVLYFRMLGQCSNCPSAVVTAEELVAPPILEAIPEIRQVVLDTTVSDELWQDAMELLRRRHNGET